MFSRATSFGGGSDEGVYRAVIHSLLDEYPTDSYKTPMTYKELIQIGIENYAAAVTSNSAGCDPQFCIQAIITLLGYGP